MVPGLALPPSGLALPPPDVPFPCPDFALGGPGFVPAGLGPAWCFAPEPLPGRGDGAEDAEGECRGGTAVVARVVGVDTGTAVPVAATGVAVEEGWTAWVCCAAVGVEVGVAGLDAPVAGWPVGAVPDQVAATVTRAATAAAAAADSPQVAR